MTNKPPAFSIKVEEGDIEDPIQRGKKALREMKENMDFQLETQRVLAKIMKAKFDALIEEGFSEQQALMLVK